MGICSDPRLTYLNDLGYNVVRLPRRDIVPLGVIGRDNKSKTWLGTLDQIWKSEESVPVAGDPTPVAGVGGTNTSDLKLSFGLDILKNALNGMFGAAAPGIDAVYRHARSIQFRFKEVRSVGIDPFVIGNFLARGDLASNNAFVKRYFGGQKHVEALVVTEVLEARSIGVIARKDANTELEVDLPELQGLLGAKIGVAAGDTSRSEIVFEGPDFLAFGYKPFGIGIRDGQWEIYGVAADSEYSFALNDTKPQPIVDAGELVEVEFGSVDLRPLQNVHGTGPGAP